uniref:Uncharacterized protein n=1 Tax=Chromera velia CCMP2878 TaxID=1169474 RepID=A0A0G4FT65_9ALVE|eukprot:Cvel_18621.t1-p1 / transcript=Cvel_18621.t1 / gene=Cvel_18621 / organism=Chromera_velia_CCMP2878 / gene_product=hypothetical protein / transcript_product=hypothetical protein / location=Cvel_scaffold1554:34194-34418(-) / protein_length=75 / sequence_SO=supercontig / SO=protein_coding / is_pseudo=false
MLHAQEAVRGAVAQTMANLGETDPLGTVPGRVSRAVLETVSDESFERLYFRLAKAAVVIDGGNLLMRSDAIPEIS